jgi:hypothetical protein
MWQKRNNLETVCHLYTWHPISWYSENTVCQWSNTIVRSWVTTVSVSTGRVDWIHFLIWAWFHPHISGNVCVVTTKIGWGPHELLTVWSLCTRVSSFGTKISKTSSLYSPSLSGSSTGTDTWDTPEIVFRSIHTLTQVSRQEDTRCVGLRPNQCPVCKLVVSWLLFPF